MENPVNDKTLLELLSTGSHKAFREIFERYKVKVYSYAFKICRETHLAEEVVQDVFMKVWTSRTSFLSVNKLDSYIMVMARNQSFMVLKRIALDHHYQTMKGQEWSEVHQDTEELVFYRETNALLENALSTLPPQQRIIYKMCHLDGLKHQEVADRLSISPLTVKSHLRYAVKTVRALVISNFSLIFFLAVNQLFKK
jgi:RNA polymerase sigma-70 factor (family 1)